MSDQGPYPSPRTGWTLTGLLTLAYIFSYIDRSILGLLIGPIKAQFHLDDTKVGLLIGVAFGIFYALLGPPLGWLADHMKRTRLVAIGVALWSLATAACGLTTSFAQLFISRMFVGVGEAVLSPAALSLISDSFPEARRGKPVALYSTALGLGSGVALLTGAAVLTWAKDHTQIDLPLVGAVAPWSATFIAVGLPGLAIALGFLLLPEPPRRKNQSIDNSVADAWREISGHWGAYFGIFLLASVMTIIAYSQGGFAPEAFRRSFDWPTQKFALFNGISTLIVAPATMAITGLLNDRMGSRGKSDAAFVLLRWSFVALIPIGALPYLMPSAWLGFVAYAFTTIPIAMVTATAMLSLLAITPGAVRGQIIALYYVVISLSGLLLGPTTVGLLSTHIYGEANLGFAIASAPIVFGIVPLLLLGPIGRAYGRKLSSLQ